ncbi:MAG: hypothetical protein JOZ43_00225 [Acidobacteriales bacterium]|nr:hypothetical protein [Terriglobales bacterium]
MRKLEMWVDGKKTAEELYAFSDYTFLDASVPMSPGPHTVTFYAAGWDNWLESQTISLNVGGSGCAPPQVPGVHVCSPVNGSTVGSPVHALSSANIVGTLARSEVWVDGVKKFSGSSTTIDTMIALGSGKHRFDFYAVNTAGTKWETTVYATVP